MTFLHAHIAELLSSLPGPVSAKWPQGARFAEALAHGSMSVEVYAPVGTDPQTPHDQDELYFVHAGRATFFIAGERQACAAGSVLFVPAGVEHRFEDLSDDFSTWVVFWGPPGGE